MKRLPTYILIFIFIVVFKLKKYSQNTIPQNLNVSEKIGWIAFDKSKDNPNFSLCDEKNIEEYYQVNPSYKEGIYSINKYFQPYKQELELLCEEDGYVIIRFIINCKGQTDRYRSKFMTLNYTEEPNVNSVLQIKLVSLINLMDAWTPGKYNNQTYDSYQHIKFLFKEKTLLDILY